MRGPDIEFSNVGLALGNTRILEDVAFTVRSGSIHCIVGPNGGGKTSLVRSMLAQMPHTGGIRIRWNEGRRTGYVPQVMDFDRSLPVTVADFMALACQRRPAFLGIARNRKTAATQVLERVGLGHRTNTRIGTLSGGERQRLLFAQALVPEPSLLVLDEPTAGLDDAGERIIVDAIRTFAAAGGTVLWINHDLAQVRDVADAVTCINRRVVLHGPPREVLQNDSAAYAAPSRYAPPTEAAPRP